MNAEVLEALKEWAEDERRTASNLAIYLLEKALEQRQQLKPLRPRTQQTKTPVSAATKAKRSNRTAQQQNGGSSDD